MFIFMLSSLISLLGAWMADFSFKSSTKLSSLFCKPLSASLLEREKSLAGLEIGSSNSYFSVILFFSKNVWYFCLRVFSAIVVF